MVARFDFAIAKEFGARDVSATAMGFDALPVVHALQDMLAIFETFNSITAKRPSCRSANKSIGRTLMVPATSVPADRDAHPG